MDWNKTIQEAQGALDTVERAVAALNKYRDSSTAEIAQYLRVDKGIELDIDAIKATVTRPYTLVPINEHEAWLIHWRGVKMPIFGWVVAAEPAFIKARVTRSMDLLTPLPAWMKSELGWKPPAHAAIIDGTRTSLQLTQGDESSFKRRYGQHLGAKRADGSYAIKSGDAWIKLVAQLVRDGILPYAATPVAKENWNPKDKLTGQSARCLLIARTAVPQVVGRWIGPYDGHWHIDGIGRAPLDYVTHWQYFPNLPAEQKDGE